MNEKPECGSFFCRAPGSSARFHAVNVVNRIWKNEKTG